MNRTVFLGLVAASLLCSGPSRATQLITEEEAKLPPPKGAIAADRRGILRGPKVEFVSPGGSVASPLKLQLKFESFGGAKIDPESVKITGRHHHLKSPKVWKTRWQGSRLVVLSAVVPVLVFAGAFLFTRCHGITH